MFGCRSCAVEISLGTPSLLRLSPEPHPSPHYATSHDTSHSLPEPHLIYRHSYISTLQDWFSARDNANNIATIALFLSPKMILSPYHNPLYRTPTAKGASLSPRPEASPKRKRRDTDVDHDGATRTALVIDPVAAQHQGPDLPPGADSPRTKVAEKLQDLDIRPPPGQPLTIRFDAATARKRVKRDPSVPDDKNIALEDVFSSPELSSSSDSTKAIDSGRRSPVVEIRETPDWCSRMPSASPSRPPNRSPTVKRSAAYDAVAGARLPCPPPPPPISTPLAPPPPSEEAESRLDLSHSPQPALSQDSPPSSQAALTWQDDEITGHDIDITTPDDDGEGINGIGFKPTPTIAYARSQRRKRQVSEWRAREAREARQRRIERRRGGANASEGLPPKRSVRFASNG